jgi:beta-mannosidase
MAGFQGTLTLTAIDLQGGGAAPSVWATFPVSVPPGPGAITWLAPNATLPNATTTLLFASLTEAGVGTAFDQHLVHLTAPLNLALPRATLSATVAPQPNPDGSVDIAVSTDAVALFVTLTAGAPGRFSDNAFLLLPGAPLTVQWLPFVAGDAAADWALLKATLRIEDLSAYQVQQ